MTRSLPKKLVGILISIVLLAGCGGAPTPTPTSDPVARETPVQETPTVALTTSASPTQASARTGTPGTGTPTMLTPPTIAGSPPTGGGTPGRPGATATPLPVGVNDPSNGPLRTNRLVTFYGHPFSDKMGVLGEYDPEAMVARLKRQAAAFTAVDPSRPAIPTIELIASVAQGSPGRDGLYLLRTPPEVIEEYAQLAEKHGLLLMLDIQIGRSTVADELRVLEPFLKRPYVHLAIDPEFAVKAGQTPGDELGSIDAADILYAGKVLGDLVVTYQISDKVLMIHQFTPSMITNKQKLTVLPHIQFVLHADGFGAPALKKEGYEILVRDELVQYGGIKVFYKQDDPIMPPEEILSLVPAPVVISFQ